VVQTSVPPDSVKGSAVAVDVDDTGASEASMQRTVVRGPSLFYPAVGEVVQVWKNLPTCDSKQRVLSSAARREQTVNTIRTKDGVCLEVTHDLSEISRE
jgi:hypothetical protein